MRPPPVRRRLQRQPQPQPRPALAARVRRACRRCCSPCRRSRGRFRSRCSRRGSCRRVRALRPCQSARCAAACRNLRRCAAPRVRHRRTSARQPYRPRGTPSRPPCRPARPSCRRAARWRREYRLARPARCGPRRTASENMSVPAPVRVVLFTYTASRMMMTIGTANPAMIAAMSWPGVLIGAPWGASLMLVSSPVLCVSRFSDSVTATSTTVQHGRL